MRVTVCLAVFNGSNYLKLQLDSILTQLNKGDEVIVVNDCSTDDSEKVLNSYSDDRIKVFNNEENIGVVNSFEKAISQSSGDIIFLSDQDDIWLENKVARCIEVFKSENPLVIVSDAQIINEIGEITEPSFFEIRKSGPGVLKNFYKNSFLGCAMAFRSDVKRSVLPFPKNVPMHDEWIGLISNLVGSVKFINEPLIQYRRHGSNVTNMHRSSWGKVIIKRLILIKIVLFRSLRLLVQPQK